MGLVCICLHGGPGWSTPPLFLQVELGGGVLPGSRLPPREVEVQMNIRSFVPFTTCLGSRCQRIVITIVIVLLQINSSTYKKHTL
jgi:hypothetical protein